MNTNRVIAIGIILGVGFLYATILLAITSFGVTWPDAVFVSILSLLAGGVAIGFLVGAVILLEEEVRNFRAKYYS